MKECKSCTSFSEGFSNKNIAKAAEGTRRIGECREEKVKEKFCVDNSMLCGGEHYKKSEK